MKTDIVSLKTTIGQVVQSLVENDAHVAVKYLSPTQVVRATRKLFDRKIVKTGNIEIVLTIGRPNFYEREFIHDCKVAKEPFPVRGIILKFPPKKR